MQFENPSSDHLQLRARAAVYDWRPMAEDRSTSRNRPVQPLPDPETWWGSIAAAISLVMAHISASLIAGFAASAAAMHPELLWSLDEHVDGDDPAADRNDRNARGRR
jgi:hypothetical protein